MKAVQFGNIKADGPWYEAVFHAHLADSPKALDVQVRSVEEVRAVISQVRHRDF